MHFILSYDISLPSSSEREVIENQFREILKPYSWVKPLTTFFIIKVDSQQAYNAIYQELITKAQQYPTTVKLIVSPLMTGGLYVGYLSKEVWAAINERSR